MALSMRECSKGMQLYKPATPADEVERELGIARAIKLASNESPLGPSPKVRQALAKALRDAAVYPDGACFHLRQALAKHMKVKPEELILGNGSNELLVLLAAAFLESGDEVVTSEKSFVVYGTAAQRMNARLTLVPMKDMTYDLEAM